MQFKIHEAKTHLSRLIQRAVDGEEIIIARGDQALVKLVALNRDQQQRQLGTAAGDVTICDSFDLPLEDFRDYQ